MKHLRILLTASLLLSQAWATPPCVEGEVQAAIRKLAAADNFSWVALTIEEDAKEAKVAEAVEGQWDRSGWCRLSNPKSKTTGDAFLRGDRMAVLLADGWKVMEAKEAAPAAGKPDKSIRDAVQLLKARSPLEALKSFMGRIEDLRLRENGLYSGRYATLDIPIIVERAQAAGYKIPEVVEPVLRINFRIENGVLASYELVIAGREPKLKKGQPVDILLALSVDFSGVGTTSLDIPAEARKLLE